MARSYTATITAKAWKEHTCLNCGAVYSYLLVRKVTGQAGRAEKAQELATRNAGKAMQTQVDEHPCPTCGLVQPDMIGQKRAKRHLTIFWWTLVVFVVLLLLRVSYAVQANTLTAVTIILCAIAAGLHLFFDRANPNRDTMANQRTATERVSSGTIRHTPGSTKTAADIHVNPPRAILHSVTPLLLIGAVVLVASPEILRTVKHWPINEDCYPPVVGAGDTTRIYMSDAIHSIKGFWRGHPRVAIQTKDGQSLPAQARTNQNDWGGTISAKSSEKNSKTTPWVEPTFPDKPELANQTVVCAIDLDVESPEMTGSSTYNTVEHTMHRSLNVQMADPGAGSKYNSNWWQGTAIGMALILISGQILRIGARGLQKRANPTKIFPPT
jgi:hypothetical protein